jgi:glucose-6-phosphate isomerase
MTIKVFHSGSSTTAVHEHVPKLVRDKVASRLFAKDSTLWGEEAQEECAIRLGWVDAAISSMQLIPELRTLRTQLLERSLTRVVLCGMGGSSLAPEVITKTFGQELIVLDSTDPSQIRQALEGELNNTIVVVSSKSGSTVETDSQKRSFEQAFSEAGIDGTERIFVVTDPDSPMHKQAVLDGYRVFLADPTVGGRYSALTAFGVVPSMLAGVDMSPVLESAIEASKALCLDESTNPGLVLGAAMAKTLGALGPKDKLGLVPNGTEILGFGDWAEQLIAESTGKIGRGILPIVLELNSAEVLMPQDDVLLVELSKDASSSTFQLATSGDLGEQLLLWEVATSVASRLLGVNPFDQPDVESAKIAARSLLEAPTGLTDTGLIDDDIEILSYGFSLVSTDLPTVLSELFSKADSRSYFSIHCYLNRTIFPQAQNLRNLLAKKTCRPTTFGWGPRFLHSTGQYHKGGPNQGVFLQLVSGDDDNQPIPGREFGYRQLIDSQASGDAKVLANNPSPVLVLRMKNPSVALSRLEGLLS